MNILIAFYSKFGNTAKLAEAIGRGARSVEGSEVLLRRMDDLAPAEVIEKHVRWREARAVLKAQYQEPTLDELIWADGVIFGSPTRFGNVAAELKLFIDKAGTLWAKGQTINKVGSTFTSSSTPHGGQETTSLTLMAPMIHLGMIIVAPGYADPILFSAGSPYGATFTSGPNSDIPPSEEELQVAWFQGKRVAEVTHAIKVAKLIHH